MRKKLFEKRCTFTEHAKKRDHEHLIVQLCTQNIKRIFALEIYPSDPKVLGFKVLAYISQLCVTYCNHRDINQIL